MVKIKSGEVLDFRRFCNPEHPTRKKALVYSCWSCIKTQLVWSQSHRSKGYSNNNKEDRNKQQQKQTYRFTYILYQENTKCSSVKMSSETSVVGTVVRDDFFNDPFFKDWWADFDAPLAHWDKTFHRQISGKSVFCQRPCRVAYQARQGNHKTQAKM